MKIKASLLLLLSINVFYAQEIIDKDLLKKCRKEFSKKICLSDEDGDKIPLYLDECPTISGAEENNGCPWPDTDSDGVIDKDDVCPTIAGLKENNGCPWLDYDGDGILDKDDQCPTVAGKSELNGCPEYDCSENYAAQRKNAEDFAVRQKGIDYHTIQKHFLQIFKKTKFDSEILLFLNSGVRESCIPPKCMNLDLDQYRDFATLTFIWDKKMLNEISRITNREIFPGSYNSLRWNGGGFYRKDDEEFIFLPKKQIDYVQSLPELEDPEYGKIKYIKVKNKILKKRPADLNHIMFRQENTIINSGIEVIIKLRVTTKKDDHVYNFKYDYGKKDWLLISES